MNIIPYGKQSIDKDDIKTVVKSLGEDFLTTGNYVNLFEKKAQDYFKSKFALSCTSGTAAIHIALKSIDLKKNDKVIMPSVNFISSYNISKMLNATVFLADVDPLTGQMTPKLVEECIKRNKIKKVKLLITMYLGGYPENVLDFYKLKKKLKCYLMEDACHALGASYKFKNKKKMIGSCCHSDISIFSLHPVKSITSGEGGIITTNNKKIFNKMKLLRSHGMQRKKNYWQYDIILNGYNYRLSDINCSLGLSQFKKINRFIKKRKFIFDRYKKKLTTKKNLINNIKYDDSTNSAFHLFLLSVNFKKLGLEKNHLIRFLLKNRIKTQFHYIPIYKFKVFKEKIKIKNFEGTEAYYRNSLSIPIFFDLNIADQDRVISKIKKFITIK